VANTVDVELAEDTSKTCSCFIWAGIAFIQYLLLLNRAMLRVLALALSLLGERRCSAFRSARVRPRWARARWVPCSAGREIFVRRVPPNADAGDVRAVMERFGAVENAWLKPDPADPSAH